MSRTFRYPWLPVAILLAVGWLALLWSRQLAHSLTHFPSRAPAMKTTTTRTEPMVSQVVLVVTPGLRVSDLKSMPGWQELAKLGASGQLRAVQPTFAWPNLAAIATGAPPWMTGVLTDLHAGEVGGESLFSRLPTAVVGSFAWDRLFPGQLARSAAFANEIGDAERTPRALHWVSEGLELVVVEYASQNPASIDSQLVELSRGLDFARTALLVVSPHGRTTRGGRGGNEPEVVNVPVLLVGGPVPEASKLEGKMVDVAPTVSALLGIPPPAHSLGQPLVGPPHLRELARQRQLELTDACLSRYGLARGNGDPVSELLTKLESFELRGRGLRLVVLVVVLMALATLIVRVDRRQGLKVMVLALQWGALVALSWNLGYLVLIGPYSPSRLTSWSEARLLGLFCGLLGFALVLIVAGLRGALREPGRPASGGLGVAVGTVAFMSTQALLYGVFYGFPRLVAVPRADFTMALAALLAGLVGVCLAAPLTPWVSRLAGRWPIRKGSFGKVTG